MRERSERMDFEENARAVLAALGVPEAPRLGGGIEGGVCALDDARVVKVYRDATREYLDALAELYAIIGEHALPFATPRIAEIGSVGGTSYTIERRLHGRQWDELVGTWTTEERRRALDSFLDALPALHSISLPNHSYGQVLRLAGSLRAATWPTFLRASAERPLRRFAAHLARDVSGLDEKIVRFFAALERLPAEPPKWLVHGDYYLENVLFDEAGRLSAVLDFSPHTVVGDPLLDVAGAVSFLSLTPSTTAEDIEYARARAEVRYGVDVVQRLALYTLYYSIYFATWASDLTTDTWCVGNLNDEVLWARAVGG